MKQIMKQIRPNIDVIFMLYSTFPLNLIIGYD